MEHENSDEDNQENGDRMKRCIIVLRKAHEMVGQKELAVGKTELYKIESDNNPTLEALKEKGVEVEKNDEIEIQEVGPFVYEEWEGSLLT